MSRGLGRVQRAVLATLQAHGGSVDVGTLLQEQAVAADPDCAKTWYRAIQRLEQVGAVWATWQVAPDQRSPVGRTKRLHLVRTPVGEETPLVVLRGGVPDTTVQVTSTHWCVWARAGGYTPRYLVRRPLLPNGQGGVLTRCATRMEAEQLLAQSIDITCHVLAGAAPALVAWQYQEMTP